MQKSSCVATYLQINTPETRLVEGQHVSLQAVVHYEDGTSEDVTRKAEWAVAHSKTARFSTDNKGELVALTYGQSMIFAAWQGCNSSVEVSVRPILVDVIVELPTTELTRSETYLCHARALFSNGKSRVLLSQEGVQWQSSNESTVTVDCDGRMQAIARGGATITASFASFSKEIGVVVEDNTPYVALLLPEVIPSPLVGDEVSMQVHGVLIGGELIALGEELSWSVDEPAIGEFIDNALFKAKQPGQCQITVSIGQLKSSFSLTVPAQPELLRLSIEIPEFLFVGDDKSLLVKAHYSDQTTQDVTSEVLWSNTDEAVLSVASSGLIDSKQSGQTHLFAVYHGVAAETFIRVMSANSEHYHTNTLPWTKNRKEDRIFHGIIGGVFGLVMTVAFITPYISVPEVSREAREEVPARLAKLILKKKQELLPPPPKQELVEEKKKETKEEKKTEEKTEEVVDEVAPQSVADAREKASKSGILALTSELSDMQNDSLLDELSGNEIIEMTLPDRLESEGDGSRSMITTRASKRSGGIDTTKLSRRVGNSELATRAVTKVDAPVYIEHEKLVDKGSDGRASRSYEEVQRVFEKNKGRIYSIYNRALRKAPGLKGRVVFDITIAAKGHVIDCQVVSSDLNDPALERKLVARIMLFVFESKDVDEIIVTYPIEFLPS